MGKIQKLWNNHKRELIVGIIVSIITSILWNIITWFVRESPKMGVTLLESLRNIFYRSAAIHTESSVSEALWGLLIGFMVGIIIVSAHYIKQKVKKAIKKIEGDNKGNEKSEDNKENTITEKEKLKKIRKTNISLTFKLILIIVLLIITVSSVMIPTEIYKSFNRDMTMISPYVDNQEILLLKSKWVMMKSYDDYKEIYNIIDEIKEENNLSKR